MINLPDRYLKKEENPQTIQDWKNKTNTGNYRNRNYLRTIKSNKIFQTLGGILIHMFGRNVYTLANFLQFITHCPRLVRLWCQRFADFIAIFMTSSKHRVNLACAVRLVKLKNGKWHGSDGDKPVRNLILSILFVIVLID